MKWKGITLIEVLVVLIIVAVLSVFSLSSVSFLKNKNESQIIIDEIKSAIRYAKIQAITRGNPVLLSPLDGSNWSMGMILTEQNRTTNTRTILYQWNWHHPRWYITWAGVNSHHKLVLSNNPISAISNGQFTLFNSATKQRRIIILNRLGRVKTNTL